MPEGTLRQPVAAGRFYPGDGALLLRQIEACYSHPVGPGGINTITGGRLPIALIVPHGALGHAGPIAAHAFALLGYWSRQTAIFPSHVALLGPDHFGLGARVSATRQDYGTPLGYLPTALDLVASLCASAKRENARSELVVAEAGHNREHSLENVLPFLQHQKWLFEGAPANPSPPWRSASPKLLPLTIATQDFAWAERLGALLASCLPSEGTVLIATGDLCHCGPLYGSCPPSGVSPEAFCRDSIERVAEVLQTFDAEQLVKAHQQEAWSLCGVTALAATLHWAHLRGASEVNCLMLADSVTIARAWQDHMAIPRDDCGSLRYPWNLLTEVDVNNPVGFGSFAVW